MSLGASPPPQERTSNALSLSHLTKQILAVNDKLEHTSYPSTKAVRLSSAGNTCFSEASFGIWRSELGRWLPQRPAEVPLIAPLSQISRTFGTSSRGEEGTGGGRGPLRKAVVISCLRVALREAPEETRETGAGHSWPCSSYGVSNGPGPRLSPVSARPGGRVPGGMPPPWNLPRPRLPAVRRSQGSHKRAFL